MRNICSHTDAKDGKMKVNNKPRQSHTVGRMWYIYKRRKATREISRNGTVLIRAELRTMLSSRSSRIANARSSKRQGETWNESLMTWASMLRRHISVRNQPLICGKNPLRVGKARSTSPDLITTRFKSTGRCLTAAVSSCVYNEPNVNSLRDESYAR